jgi:hypothetical protein
MATQTEVLQASDVVSGLEKGISVFFQQDNHFCLSDNVLKLRTVLKKHFSDVYKTPAAVELALCERVEDIREKLILTEMSEAKYLAEEGKAAFQDHTAKARKLADMLIDDYKPARNYNWVKTKAESLDKACKNKQGITTEQGPKPTPFIGNTIEALDGHMVQSDFCKAIYSEHEAFEAVMYDAFMDDKPVNIMANANLLYNFLKQSYKGGPALENAFENNIEDIRERAILKLLAGAKVLAKKGNEEYKGNTRRALSVLMADVGIEGYQARFEKRYAPWFEKSCMVIKDIYEKCSLLS